MAPISLIVGILLMFLILRPAGPLSAWETVTLGLASVLFVAWIALLGTRSPRYAPQIVGFSVAIFVVIWSTIRNRREKRLKNLPTSEVPPLP